MTETLSVFKTRTNAHFFQYNTLRLIFYTRRDDLFLLMKKLNLINQFALLSFSSILLIAMISGYLISGFLADKLLYREATLTRDFIDSNITEYNDLLLINDEKISPHLESLLQRIANLADVVHVHVYSTNRNIIWSTFPQLIGKYFPANADHELSSAIKGNMAYEKGKAGIVNEDDNEHQIMNDIKEGLHFVGVYIPVWNSRHSEVIWVIEIYKQPEDLHAAILDGQKLVWIIALLGTVLLFVFLFGIFMRANRIMIKQSNKLIESESLSMIGETASAVAHSMRNPLASIRASAELTLHDDLEGARESANDIISETDRLERWARELLNFSRVGSNDVYPVKLNKLLNNVIEQHMKMIKNTGISLVLDLNEKDLMIKADIIPLEQTIGSLIVNAVEAMPSGGQLSISTKKLTASKSIQIQITDTGTGLSENIKKQLFKPFFTSKTNGSGLGLALSRRLIEHYHGSLSVENSQDKGVTATIILPAHRN